MGMVDRAMEMRQKERRRVNVGRRDEDGRSRGRDGEREVGKEGGRMGAGPDKHWCKKQK